MSDRGARIQAHHAILGSIDDGTRHPSNDTTDVLTEGTPERLILRLRLNYPLTRGASGFTGKY